MRISLIPILTCFLLFSANAQPGPQKPSDERPRVGLVLSGGAAKGIAHIGVLKVLEEAGLEPDYITGTSMGSIIGGLYAMGYRADTLERLLRRQDWDQLLSDRISLDKVLIEEKPFFQNELVEFPLEHWRLIPPSGLIRGQELGKLFSRLTAPAYRMDDFKSLPIPFTCVGADLVNGLPILLDCGNLAEAMRASMAIPTIFTPVRRDSQLLVDGGLVRNFPVREVKDMGAEIIIGVYTGAKRLEEKQLESLPNIVYQSVFLMGIQDAEENRPLCNLYIEPDLSGFGAQDFKSADSIIYRGEMAARAMYGPLKALADSINALGPPPPRGNLQLPDPLILDRIEVSGNRAVAGYQITGNFGVRPGKPTSLEAVEAGVDRLYGSNFFERVSYQLRREGEQNVLLLSVEEKPATILKATINYDSYLGAGFLFSLTRRNWLLPGSRLMVITKVAEKYRVNLNYLKYLGSSQRTSAVLSYFVNRDDLPILQNGIRTQEFRLLESIIDLRLQRRLGTNGLAGFGLQQEQLVFRPGTGIDPGFDQLNYTNHNLYAFLQVNTQDRNIFPTRGVQLDLEVKTLNNDRYRIREPDPGLPLPADSLFGFDPYFKFTADLKALIPLHRRASLELRPFGGVVWHPRNSFGDFYLIGGPEQLSRRGIPFYGLATNQIVAGAAVGGRIGYQHFFQDNLLYALHLNAGYFRYPRTPDGREPGSPFWLSGAGLTLGYQSFLGPVKLVVMIPFHEGEVIDTGLSLFLLVGHRF